MACGESIAVLARNQVLALGWDGFEQLGPELRRSAREEARRLMATALKNGLAVVHETFRGDKVGFRVSGCCGVGSGHEVYTVSWLYIYAYKLEPLWESGPRPKRY